MNPKTRRNFTGYENAIRRLMTTAILEGNGAAADGAVDTLFSLIEMDDGPDRLRSRVKGIIRDVAREVRKGAMWRARTTDGAPPPRVERPSPYPEPLAGPRFTGKIDWDSPVQVRAFARLLAIQKRENPDRWTLRNPSTLRGILLSTQTHVVAEIPWLSRNAGWDREGDVQLHPHERRDLPADTQPIPGRALADYQLGREIMPHLFN